MTSQLIWSYFGYSTMNKTAVIAVFILTSSLNLLSHDILVSPTEVSLKENNTHNISLHIFFDELIENYINSNIKLHSNAQQLEPFYVENFTDNMAVWVELPSSFLPTANSYLIKENTILHKEFDDQFNILNWNREQKTSSVSFTRKKRKTTIQV